MMERPDDSEALLKELLKESILKTPSRDFTAQLMLQVAPHNNFMVEMKQMKRRLFQQTILLLGSAAISLVAFIYLGFNYIKLPANLQIGHLLSTQILNASQKIVSNIFEVSYIAISILLLWLLDRLYVNFRMASQK